MEAWQNYGEYTPMRLSGLIYQFTTMISNHFLGDTQSQSAVGSICPAFICPIESVKDAGLVLRGDAGAIILDCYYDIP